MRVDYLKYILVTVETKSISAAARELYIQQTTLSSAIKSVENELGVQLFSRFHNGVELTDDGVRVIPYIREIVDSWQHLKEHSQNKTEKFLIYAHSHASDNYAMEILRQVSARIPDIPVSIMEYSSVSLLDYLSYNPDARVGIGICDVDELQQYCKKAAERNITLELLCSTKIRAFVQPESPFAQRDIIDVSELAHEHLVLETCDIERYYKNKLDKHIPKYTVLSNSHLVRVAVVNCGYVGLSVDISVLPKGKKFPLMSGLKMIDITGIATEEQYYLAYRNEYKFSAQEAVLLQCIRDSFFPRT